MAQSFTALGKGNGFNRCLGEIDLNGGSITNLDDGGTVSLAINDTVDGGVVYNVFKVYALE